MVMSPVHQVRPKPSCKAQWKGEEDKAGRGRGGKTSGNRQAWSSPNPRHQYRTGRKMRKLVAKSSVVPQWPSRLRDRWWWWRVYVVGFFASLQLCSTTTDLHFLPRPLTLFTWAYDMKHSNYLIGWLIEWLVCWLGRLTGCFADQSWEWGHLGWIIKRYWSDDTQTSNHLICIQIQSMFAQHLLQPFLR